jgi:poly-gamma-glutamate synthase PgsB/CapB
VFTTLFACLLVLLVLGGAERLARDRALGAVPIRIHVNGTRAKSTVTRLIWSALAESGTRAVAKTTGTAARILLPDRREVPAGRRGPANIREQLGFLRLARHTGARAAVVECMALDPVLQQVTERQMIRATIGVITNVRLDHTEVMGPDLRSIAAALANSIPEGGVLVTGQSPFVALFRQRAEAVGTRLVVADPPRGDGPAAVGHEHWLDEDTALALAVTRQLGIDDAVARRGFARAPRDPGAARPGSGRFPNGDIAWLDATAANDPESLALLVDDFAPWQEPATGDGLVRPRVLVYHHRPDRVPRLECFAAHSPAFATSDRLVITGARPPVMVWRKVARLRATRVPEFVAPAALPGWLAGCAPATMVFCGNTRGLDVPHLFGEAVTRG